MERCACGRARRKKAEACQKCLDAADAARRAAEPPRRWAREWRAAGWLCAFINGYAVIARKLDRRVLVDSARSAPIAHGAWSLNVDPNGPGWTRITESSATAFGRRLDEIARDCYCASFPDTGCDFCNGTRLPDGAQELR